MGYFIDVEQSRVHHPIGERVDGMLPACDSGLGCLGNLLRYEQGYSLFTSALRNADNIEPDGNGNVIAYCKKCGSRIVLRKE